MKKNKLLIFNDLEKAFLPTKDSAFLLLQTHLKNVKYSPSVGSKSATHSHQKG
jgi:hypothetical protein